MGLALVGGFIDSFVVIVGWFGCLCLYYLFTIGKCIVSVRADSVLVCMRGIVLMRCGGVALWVLRCFFYACTCVCGRAYASGLRVYASVYVFMCLCVRLGDKVF